MNPIKYSFKKAIIIKKVKVTPKIHTVKASHYQLNLKNKISSVGDLAENSSLNDSLAGFGSILSIAASASAKITSSVMESNEGTMLVDLTKDNVVKLKVTMNAFGKTRIIKED